MGKYSNESISTTTMQDYVERQLPARSTRARAVLMDPDSTPLTPLMPNPLVLTRNDDDVPFLKAVNGPATDGGGFDARLGICLQRMCILQT